MTPPVDRHSLEAGRNSAPGKLVYFYPTGHQAHQAAGHPERPERVETIKAGLQSVGWWDSFPLLEPYELPGEVLHQVHSPAYLQRLEMAGTRGGYLDPDTYLTPQSWELALRSAGGAAAVADAVWQGNFRRGFAFCRPPGHHATPGQGMGFCLLNNIALAAEFLLLARGAMRLAVVDLDLHHGNGTQEVFWDRGEVFYLSIHQFPHYPGTGRLSETGTGPGEGKTANLPLPPYSGDRAYLTAMEKFVLPLLVRFEPQMILVSAGWDAHWRDPLGNLLLSASVYGELIARMSQWADENCRGRIALFLEGGYDLQAGRECSRGAVGALLGEPVQDSLGPSPWKEGQGWTGVFDRAIKLWGL